ncbi:MAG: alpha/beta hydrolase [Planctomycetes bacterium]|nr:alpha/beta hydrolase [Planctomycetota bacterium]
MDQNAFLNKLLPCILLLTLSGCPFKDRGTIHIPLLARGKDVKTYFAETNDGWEIAIHRFKPEGPDSGRVPVILCHGLGYNGRFWSLDAEHDFPSYLRDAGYDTWVVDLRGAGESAKPVWDFVRLPDVRPREVAKMKLGNLDWCADEHIQYDVPAAVDLVRKETGRDKVAWVGHSLGGMIMFGYLEKFGDEKIQCFAAIGSPMIIPRPPNNILRDIPGFQGVMKMVNNRWQAIAGAATLSQFKSPIDTLFYNKDNVALPVIMALYLHATEDLPPKMIAQTLVLAKTGEFTSMDGSFNYTAEVGKTKIPILLIAGKVDNMGDCEGVREVYHRVSSKDKTFRLFGLANGDSIDYGHDDLIIGRRAPKEVFPFIRNWLDKRTTIASGSPPK